MSKVTRNIISFFMSLFFLTISLGANQQAVLLKNIPVSSKKTVKILAIDGGGIRGLIPALILQNLESRLRKKRLAECFDIMAGTSTGGIIILMLNTPDKKGRPKYRAKEIVEIYQNFGKEVFTQSTWQYIKSFNGWTEAKYSSDKLKYFFQSYFASTKISESVSNIIIPAYDIEDDRTFFFRKSKDCNYNIENDEIFSSKKSKDCDVEYQDFYLRDVALATSAAPTYFKPAIIKNLDEQEKFFIDGGIAINNPALIALRHAQEIYGKDCHYLLVSLGTGTFFGAPQKIIQSNKTVEKGGIKQWMEDNELISLMLYAGSDVVDDHLKCMSKSDSKINYFRFQSILDNVYTATDNASPQNIEALKKYAHKIIDKQAYELNYLAQILEE